MFQFPISDSIRNFAVPLWAAGNFLPELRVPQILDVDGTHTESVYASIIQQFLQESLLEAQIEGKLKLPTEFYVELHNFSVNLL